MNLTWHKTSAGQYRATTRGDAWIEVSRGRDRLWRTHAWGWPVPSYVVRVSLPVLTLRKAKADAEVYVTNAERALRNKAKRARAGR